MADVYEFAYMSDSRYLSGKFNAGKNAGYHRVNTLIQHVFAWKPLLFIAHPFCMIKRACRVINSLVSMCPEIITLCLD